MDLGIQEKRVRLLASSGGLGLSSARFGDPGEYGAMIAYLSGQYAGYRTGANWRIDGGNVKAL